MYALDLPAVLEQMTAGNIERHKELVQGRIELQGCDWNHPEADIHKLMQHMQPVDLIVCSDVIFNMEQLARVPTVLRFMLLGHEQDTVILCAYRDRNEEISNLLYTRFTQAGLTGEQVRRQVTRVAE